MSYRVVILKRAAKRLAKLPPKDYQKVKIAIRDLAVNPRPQGYLKLKGSNEKFRIRVGNYRVIYEIIDRELVVTVIDVGHRKDIYR